MVDPEQVNLFDIPPDWTEKWKGMPEFESNDLTARQSIIVNFKNSGDRVAFGQLINQQITDLTKSVWYPKAEIGHVKGTSFTADTYIGPQHPIYIVSKGRWAKRLTSDSLHELKVPHFLVVEQSEYEKYLANAAPSATILVLDPKYLDAYDTFDDLGATKSKGPGAARNFAWEHSMMLGATWHWVMDDNINGFYRYHNNLKTPVDTGAIFRSMEDFCMRYENIQMAGPNYCMFVIRKNKLPPFVFNTRIYSCNLIKNEIRHRWRGRYNEDTDLSLRILLDRRCTVQFNAFLQLKTPTQYMGGGNTEAFYAKEGTKPKSDMLVKMHPTLARVVYKFGRWHHFVNYRQFRDIVPILRPDLEIKAEADNFGMELTRG